MNKGNSKEYRTMQHIVKKDDDIFEYCDCMCFLGKNLYNVCNFYIRQCMTSVKKSVTLRSNNEKQVLVDVKNAILKHNASRLEKYYASKNSKAWNKKTNVFSKTSLPSRNKWFLSYETLDNVLKTTKNVDYYAMPSQANQQMIKDVIEAWNSYFSLNTMYKQNPSSLKGKPKIPKYANKNGRKVVTMPKQIVKLHYDTKSEQYYIQFPKDKTIKDSKPLRYYIGSVLPNDLIEKQYQQIRIVPKGGCYIIEIVFLVGKKQMVTNAHERIAGIDLGVNNFIAMVDNTGNKPVIIKGGVIKSRNQYYNKQRAYYSSILRHGKESSEGVHSSKRLQKLDMDRNNFVKDYMHKASHMIVDICIERNIDTIVIGKNDGWKQRTDKGTKNNQNFVNIPHAKLISMIQYKANAAGIEVILTEESYTSKASFLDRDEMPVYGQDNNTKYTFSGKRHPRGIYTTKNGIRINSDVNGAANIMRKVFPMAITSLTDRGVLDAPVMLSIA